MYKQIPPMYKLVCLLTLSCRNGKDLGVAFDDVQFGSGLAYFPAVSLSYGESCQLNFGAFPFKYPFKNVQQKME